MGSIGAEDPTLFDLAVTMAALKLAVLIASGIVAAAIGFLAAYMLRRRQRHVG